MRRYLEITDVFAREVLDSRGNPTIEVEVHTTHSSGSAIVPSGASTGAFEATELRDNEPDRYNGKGVKNAVANVNNVIADEIIGMNAFLQREIDEKLISLDGTKNKSKLGANAILGTSLAVAKASANATGLPLYQYIGGVNSHILPVPMMNILNGGAHADNTVDIQEFMIMPFGAESFNQCLQWCSEVFYALKSILKEKGLSTSVGDEGGFAPNLQSDEEALSLLVSAIGKAGFKSGEDFMIAIDAASTEWVTKNGYTLPKSNITKTSDALIDYWADLCEKYPIFSIEDPLGEEDWQGWQKLTKRLGDKVQLVGDDLFVTNIKRLQKGIDEDCGNAILIKPNQIGTLSETIDAVEMAHKNGYSAVMSHRSGESEDTTIADMAVALSTGQIKTGAPSRTDRVAKYNQLLRIEEDLGFVSEYGE